jgi:hypothetical protein
MYGVGHTDVPKLAIGEFTILLAPFAEDVKSCAAAGAQGGDIYEAEPPAGRNADMQNLFAAAGVQPSLCIGVAISALPGALFPDPAGPGDGLIAMCASVERPGILAQVKKVGLVYRRALTGDEFAAIAQAAVRAEAP